jgi:hypothetical protein
MTDRWLGWSLPALEREVVKGLAEVEGTGGLTFTYARRVEKFAVLVGAYLRKGGKVEGLVDMSSLELVEAQLQTIIAQTTTAMEMVRQLKSGGGSHAAAAPASEQRRVVPIDPIASLRVEMAKQVALGRNWESGIDNVDQSLVLAATRQFSEGPGRGAGRRSVEGFRKFIMDGVPGKAA